MSFPEALWVCCGWVFTLEGVPLLSPSPGTATASPTGSVHLEPRNPQPTCAGWALFAFIANQNHSFGVSKSIIPTPHNLVPIYGIVLLPCSQLGKHPLTKICTSHCHTSPACSSFPIFTTVSGASFSWLTLSAVSLGLHRRDRLSHLTQRLQPASSMIFSGSQRDAPTDFRDRWEVSSFSVSLCMPIPFAL